MDLWWPQAKFSVDALNFCLGHPIHYRGALSSLCPHERNACAQLLGRCS